MCNHMVVRVIDT